MHINFEKVKVEFPALNFYVNVIIISKRYIIDKMWGGPEPRQLPLCYMYTHVHVQWVVILLQKKPRQIKVKNGQLDIYLSVHVCVYKKH